MRENLKLNSSYEDEASVTVDKKTETVPRNQGFPRQMVGLEDKGVNCSCLFGGHLTCFLQQ